MGQLQHLERLILGRSAFEDLDLDQVPSETAEEGVQQYDAKGRPVDPTTERINAEQRRAQNEILALVGVVEHKDEIHRRRERKYRELTEARRVVFEQENDFGSILELLAFIPSLLAHAYVRAFVGRVQIGLYDCQRPMASISADNWHPMPGAGWLQRLSTCFPGSGELAVNAFVVTPLSSAMLHVVGEVVSYIGKQNLSRRSARCLGKALDVIVIIWELGIDFAMIPLTLFDTAHRLGLAPALPLFPPLNAVLPWKADSLYRCGWKPQHLPFVYTLFPPALLIFANYFLWRESFDSIGFSNDSKVIGPLLPKFTSQLNPNIDNAMDMSVGHSFTTSPVAWLSRTGCRLRNVVLQWTGWRTSKNESLRHTDNRVAEHPLIVRHVDGSGRLSQQRSSHRNTALGQMPVSFLASKIEFWFARPLTLPLESLLLRSVAFAYMQSPLWDKTPQALLAAKHLYRPFGGGPFGQLISSRGSSVAWVAVGCYSGHLALALALDCSIDVLCFSMNYGLARWFGVTKFGYGYRRRAVTED